GDPDAIASHNRGLLLARFIQEEGFERHAVLGSKFENMAYFDCALHLERFSAGGARFARLHGSQVRPVFHCYVAANGNISQMKSVFVCTGRHGVRTPQAFVGINRKLTDSDCSEAAGMRAQRRYNFLRVCGTERWSSKSSRKFCLVQRIVA